MKDFKPKYSISNKLLINIKEIGLLTGELNSKVFPSSVLVKLEKDARALSAYSSTSIEGNPLPLTDVKKILKSKPENIRDSEREVLNYNTALILLDERINKENNIKISDKIICDIQQVVVKGLLLREKGYRAEPVVVNDPRTRQTVYLPPDHQDVPSLMTNLIEFINSNNKNIDPLILSGIFHKQFVTIHPFVDGNGRTARLITKLLLANMGLNTFHLFSFENYYNNNISKYFKNVGVVGDYYDIKNNLDFTFWLEYFTEGIVDELKRVKKVLPSYQPRLEDHHKKILKYIEKNGSINTVEYEKISGRKKATRIIDFKFLIDLGLIERKEQGKASYYILKTN
ncbi:MAG: Fic family protein [bacterium]